MKNLEQNTRQFTFTVLHTWSVICKAHIHGTPIEIWCHYRVVAADAVPLHELEATDGPNCTFGSWQIKSSHSPYRGTFLHLNIDTQCTSNTDSLILAHL